MLALRHHDQFSLNSLSSSSWRDPCLAVHHSMRLKLHSSFLVYAPCLEELESKLFLMVVVRMSYSGDKIMVHRKNPSLFFCLFLCRLCCIQQAHAFFLSRSTH